MGRVKFYNKAVEAGLTYPLTRLEMTLDPSTPYEKISFPTVYYLDDMQMSFSSYKATETERFILNALFQGCGTLDQLGRRTREKIKVLMADHVKKVEIRREDYEQFLKQVKTYASGNVQSTATDQDQPPNRLKPSKGGGADDLGKAKKDRRWQIVVPDFVIDTMARCLLPQLQAFYASLEGQAAFDAWKQAQKAKV